MGIGGAILLFIPDHEYHHFFYLKTQIGAGYEQQPVILNSNDASTASMAAYPFIYAGLKIGLFNNKGISVHVNPFYTHSVNGIISAINISQYSYGGNLTLLLGKSCYSKFKFFVEGGYTQRKLVSFTDAKIKANTSGEYAFIRYGGGIMFSLPSKNYLKESYIKPGIFFEQPSPTVSSQSKLVANLQILIKSFITIDCSYSSNYFSTGVINYPNNFTQNSNNFFSIKLVKAGNIFGK